MVLGIRKVEHRRSAAGADHTGKLGRQWDEQWMYAMLCTVRRGVAIVDGSEHSPVETRLRCPWSQSPFLLPEDRPYLPAGKIDQSPSAPSTYLGNKR